MRTLSFLDGDVMRSTINRVSAINFSERVHQILVKDMATTVVEIEGLIGKVTKLDFQIDKGSSGKFARMVVFGYLQNLFPGVGSATNIVVGSDSTVGASSMNDKVAKLTEAFRPWMLVK
ncbi:hypothetical protein Gotri_026370 [Gossypium trilobum]|uniref:Uncharacterized protein n=1 Tax=Gossypium trilobum TaxID=34281 RepID=A0A7J9FSU5_9ROSI|nr:hypothetical protein [Gossypium trilobum]